MPRHTKTFYLVKLDMGDGTDEELVVRARSAARACAAADHHLTKRFHTVPADYTAEVVDVIDDTLE